MTTRNSPLLPTLLVASLVPACAGGGGTEVTPAPPNTPTMVVFERANSYGGSDLYRAPIDDSERPVNLTRHQGDTIAQVWPRLVGDRIVYTAGRSPGLVDFYSVPIGTPPGTGPGYTKLTTQSLGTPDAGDWDVVGDRVVVLVTVEGTDRLVSFTVDGSDFQQLTTFANGASIDWPRDTARRRNAVTAAGKVVFELTEGHRRSVRCVAADGGEVQDLSTAVDATVQLDVFGRPMIRDDVVIVRESRGNTTRFLACNTIDSAKNRWLTRSLAQHEQVGRTFFHGQSFGFEITDTSTTLGIDNLFSVPLTAPTLPNGDPIANNLTGFNRDGSEILALQLAPGTDRIALAVEVPSMTAGRVQADVLSVRLDEPGQTLQLTRPIAPVASGDIRRLEVCRDHVVFERVSQPQTVWNARLDQAGSEVDTLPAQAGNRNFIAYAVHQTERIDPVSRLNLVDPGQDVVDAVVIGVTNTDLLSQLAYTNFFLASPGTGAMTTRQLTSQRDIADGTETPRILMRQDRRIVYQRSGLLFAADLDQPHSEITILNSAMIIERVFAYPGAGASGHFLLQANGQLFATRIDQPATTPGSLRQLTALLPLHEEIADVHFDSKERVVFTIRGLGRERIVSIRLDADASQLAEISEAIYGVDELRLAL